MATTIRQVAAAAGVSIATASRALSGSSSVVEQTRLRVMRAAADLDYNPSRPAKSLATGSTGNIGVVLPDLTNPFYTAFLASIEAAAAARDVGILIGNSREDPGLEQVLVRRMTTQVDALVLASSRLTDQMIVSAANRLPVVLANRRLARGTLLPERLSQLIINVEPGFSAAVRHLHALGHRSLLYVDGPPNSWSGHRKCRTLARVCAELGITLTILDSTGRPDFAAGKRAAARIRAMRESAVMTFNDQMALGLLSALREAGIAVPGQISVIGCDDSLPDGLAWPALTTVDSSSATLGALTAEAVLGSGGGMADSVPTRLIVRSSTATSPSFNPRPSRNPSRNSSPSPTMPAASLVPDHEPSAAH